MIRIAVLLLALTAFTSCTRDGVTESAAQNAYELWRSKNIHDYSIDQMRSCFCPDAGQLVRITVRSDTIYSVIRISDNTVLSNPFFFTVDSLFGIINNSKTDSLVIRYNKDYGFPEFLDINPQQHPYDGGVLYETSNLKIKRE